MSSVPSVRTRRAPRRRVLLLGALALATACGGADAARPDWVPAGVDPRMVERRADGVVIASQDSLRTLPGYVVDSIFPPPVALERWKAKLGGTGPTALAGGAPTVDSLFRAYVAALVGGDTLALPALALSDREFAWLYYADSPEAQQGVMPQVAWELMTLRGASGLGRARLAALQGGAASVERVRCGPTDVAVGAGRMRGPCTAVLRRPDGSRDTVGLARFVLERDGRVKFMSFANAL